MKPLAHLALDQGLTVLGHDHNKSPHTDELVRKGMTLLKEEDFPSLEWSSIKEVVHSSAIKDHPLFALAKSHSIPIRHRSEWLRDLSLGKKLIAVAGTHGKTTTTALIIHFMEQLGLNPSYYLGGDFASKLPSGRLTDSPYLIMEADESDGSFLKFEPHIALITDLGLDHLDYYQNVHHIIKAFEQFMAHTDPEGFVIHYWDNPYLKDLSKNFFEQRLAYGETIGSDMRILQFKTVLGITSFSVMLEKELVKGEVPLIGRFNLLNSLAALSVAYALKLPLAEVMSSLKSFPGVKRRLSLSYSKKGLKIYDDYAHNPDKITAVLAGLRDAFPSHKIHAIFQPHRYSRLENMYNEFIKAFKHSDLVYVLPVYSAGESPKKDLTLFQLAKDIEKNSTVLAYPCHQSDFLCQSVYEHLSGRDIVVALGAGDVMKVSNELKEFIKEKA